MTTQANDSHVTLTDVANSAGVSQSTVSRVLSKHPKISQQTRDLVIAKIHEMGYDIQAIEKKIKARASRQPMTDRHVEILLCPLTEQKNILALHFFSEVVEGIQAQFHKTGRLHDHVSIWEPSASEKHQQNQQILARLAKADGILLLGNPTDQLISQITHVNERCVFVSTGRDQSQLNTVGSDNIVGGMQAAKYLIDCGFDRIGFLEGPPHVREWQQRKAGAMIQTMQMIGADRFSSRSSASTELSDLTRTFEVWLDSGDCPPAMILPFAESVIGIELVLAKRNMSCPEDLSLFTFDEPNLDTFDIKPTHLCVFLHRIGRKASERLIQLLNDKDALDYPHHLVVPMQLVTGNSVKALSPKI